MRELPPPILQERPTHVVCEGRTLLYFGGCDYFRLSSNPHVVEAACNAAREFGLGVAASRRTTGNHPLYEKLETSLAKFFGTEAALLVNSGYATAPAVAQACPGAFDHVLLDERSHPCIADVAPHFAQDVRIFKHRDPDDFARVAEKIPPAKNILLMTDGMFAHDGSVAPLAEYQHRLPRDAWMLVDDAHGAGVLGPRGRGSIEHAGISRRRAIQLVTLSKAFGAAGGAVLGPRSLMRRIVAQSSAFVGSTPPALPMAAAALASLELLSRDGSFRERLTRNSALLKQGLRESGWPIEATPGPVAPVVPRTRREAMQLKARLLDRGIFPTFIHYPGGANDGYFRLAVSSEHTPELVTALTEAFDVKAALSKKGKR